jgi:hypothetical protein
MVMACLGYASAEALLNVKVLDGSQLKGSNRLCLARSIGAIFWASSIYGSGAYMLSCEFNHSYGTPSNYAAMVELATWADGGGLFVVSLPGPTATGLREDRRHPDPLTSPALRR